MNVWGSLFNVIATNMKYLDDPQSLCSNSVAN